MSRLILPAILVATAMTLADSAYAQLTVPRKLSATPDPIATLEEQLINRLKATTPERKGFVKFVVKRVRQEKLSPALVVAIERKAIRKNRFFPFPYFERAIRFEANKRNVALPPVRQFATTKSVPDRIGTGR